MAILPPAISLGSVVEWSSQSQGFTKEKRGVVVQVVMPGERPIAGSLRVLGAGFGAPRDHVSYLVRVGNVAYWPIVTKLRVVPST